MKKILLVFALICCIASFSACGTNDNAGNAGQNGNADEKITVDGSMQTKTVVANGNFMIAVKEDGTVVNTGRSDCDTSSWTDIVQVSSESAVLGLKSDGTVVITGVSEYSDKNSVTAWADIVKIDDGGSHVVGLKSDGTVISTAMASDSALNKGQTQVSSWTDIVDVAASAYNTVGLKSDGSVVATGIIYRDVVNGHDLVDVRYNSSESTDISSWNDIVAIAASSSVTVGLKSDGTVVVAGDIDDVDVSDWRNIVAIDVHSDEVIGLKSDGTLISTRNNFKGYTDIAAFSLGNGCFIAADKNGTITGYYSSDKVDFSVFKDVKAKVK